MRKLLNLLGPALGLVLVLAVFSILSYRPDRGLEYLSIANVKQVGVQTAILAICGIGMTFVIISGGIDLSIGSIVALANVTVVLVLNGQFAGTLLEVVFRGQQVYAWITAAVLAATVIGVSYARTRTVLPSLIGLAVSALVGYFAFAGSGAVAAFCAGTAVGLLCGWINGLLVTSTGVVPFIITLGTMEAFRGMTLLLAKSTKVYVSPDAKERLRGADAWLDHLMAQDPDPEWIVVSPGLWLMALAAVVGVVLLSRLQLGRFIFAIGSNEEAGRLSGLNVTSVKRWVYSLSGLAAGLAGVLQFSRTSSGSPTDAVGLELDVIAAVVIGGGSLRGGEGSIWGTLIGAFILGFMRNGFLQADIPIPVQRILIGTIIVLAVALDEMRHRGRRR